MTEVARVSGLGKKVRRQALMRAARARRRAQPLPGAPLAFHRVLVEQDLVRAMDSTVNDEGASADDHPDD